MSVPGCVDGRRTSSFGSCILIGHEFEQLEGTHSRQYSQSRPLMRFYLHKRPDFVRRLAQILFNNSFSRINGTSSQRHSRIQSSESERHRTRRMCFAGVGYRAQSDGLDAAELDLKDLDRRGRVLEDYVSS